MGGELNDLQNKLGWIVQFTSQRSKQNSWIDHDQQRI